MIRSMTAFARGESQQKYGRLVWEIRSVNHRYLEVTTRMPDDFRALEPQIKKEISAVLNRGKVECNLRFSSSSETGDEITVNEALVKKLVNASRIVDGLLYSPSPVNSMDVLRWPGVIAGAELEIEAARKQAVELLKTTLSDLVAMREGEGDKIRKMIEQRCDTVNNVIKLVRAEIPEIIKRRREKLKKHLEDLNVEADSARLEQELAIQIQKLDVDEEMDRLDAHLEEVQRLVNAKEPVGRRLDFLLQELNREANTLGSKSVDVGTSKASVDLKVSIEQMREQIQNIE